MELPPIPQMAAIVERYTATELVTILAAVGVLITSIFTGIVTVIGTLRNGQRARMLAAAIVGDDLHTGLVGQVKEVHTLTNANMTAANNKIDKQTLEIRALLEMVQDLRSERNKRDISVAKVTRSTATPPADPAINMEVAEMHVEEFNAPNQEKEEDKNK